MAIEDDPELEYSTLCGPVIREGVTVVVNIFRIADNEQEWSLEVVDDEGASTVWEDRFVNDTDAYAEFVKVLEAEGIRSFRERPAGKPH